MTGMARLRRKVIRRLWASVLSTLAACNHYPTCPQPSGGLRKPSASNRPPSISAATSTVGVLGDLQGLLPAERLFREDNTRETRTLVCQLGQEPLDVVVLLGDLVNWGSSEARWKDFDELMTRTRAKLLPVRGNHDLMGDAAQARRAWLRRFRWFAQSRWYEVDWSRLGLLFLDSNLTRMGQAEQLAEHDWYERELDRLEQDRQIQGIVVFLHHAPYTLNPNAQKGLEALRKAFVDPLCAHSKALVMISGHAHGYERYAGICHTRWTQFIVSGGGGGPRPKLAHPIYDDACLAAGCCDPSERPMHYLSVTQFPWGVSIVAQTLKSSGHAGVLDVVRLPFLGQSVPASPPEPKACDRLTPTR
jgi:predicted phosphodiesterase